MSDNLPVIGASYKSGYVFIYNLYKSLVRGTRLSTSGPLIEVASAPWARTKNCGLSRRAGGDTGIGHPEMCDF